MDGLNSDRSVSSSLLRKHLGYQQKLIAWKMGPIWQVLRAKPRIILLLGHFSSISLTTRHHTHRYTLEVFSSRKAATQVDTGAGLIEVGLAILTGARKGMMVTKTAWQWWWETIFMILVAHGMMFLVQSETGFLIFAISWYKGALKYYAILFWAILTSPPPPCDPMWSFDDLHPSPPKDRIIFGRHLTQI